jgi:predicted membrane protein
MFTINTKLAAPFAILGALVALSYFTKDGWWTWAGLIFLIGNKFGEAKQNEIGYIFVVIALILFVLGIFTMPWNYYWW